MVGIPFCFSSRRRHTRCALVTGVQTCALPISGAPAHDDLVRRVFTADAPNRLWLTDITEHWTNDGKLYLCAVKDVYSNRIVGYSIDSRMKARLAVNALDNAVARRGEVAGCILHSDRWSQFRSRKQQRALTRHGMVGSMGQVGSAGDNAAMASFFALPQKNVLARQPWAPRDENGQGACGEREG